MAFSIFLISPIAEPPVLISLEAPQPNKTKRTGNQIRTKQGAPGRPSPTKRGALGRETVGSLFLQLLSLWAVVCVCPLFAPN